MPRGFLVKRSQHLTAFSYRDRRGSEEDRASDSGSELDGAFTNTCYGSPDSGFSVSPGPVSVAPPRDRAWERDNAHTITNSWTTSMVASSLPLALTSSCSASSTRLSSLSPLSSSSLASPSIKSAPCTPNKVTTTSISTTGTTTEQVDLSKKGAPSDLVNQPSPLTFTAFDTLTLGAASKTQQPGGASPARSGSGPGSGSGTPTPSLSPAPSSPGGRKRSGSRTDEKSAAPSQSGKGKAPSPKKLRAARRINFDVDTTSPVSGTIIKELSDCEDDQGRVTVYGDIEPSFNVVEITPEARAELEKIDNKLGDYVCQLCKELYEDAFQLARHRCSRIVHVEYRCPECDKVFNCPANLASHRRWHKPRPAAGSQPSGKSSSSSSASSHRSLLPAPAHRQKTGLGPTLLGTGLVPTATTDPEKLLLTRLVSGKAMLGGGQDPARGAEDRMVAGGDRSADEAPFSCDTCGKRFRRQAYLRKHAQSHAARGGAGRPKPCLLCGKILLNDNDRLKHEAEHKNQLVNSNILNNNNVAALSTSASAVSRTSPTTAAIVCTASITTTDSQTLASLDTNTLNNNNNINTNGSHSLPPRPKGTILTTPTLSPRDLNTQAPASNALALPSARDTVCSVCGATCTSKAALEKHVRSHAQETFPCKYCDSTFYSSPGLTRHINKCHPTENRQVILLQLPVSRTC